jgi:hypothetical protein
VNSTNSIIQESNFAKILWSLFLHEILPKLKYIVMVFFFFYFVVKNFTLLSDWIGVPQYQFSSNDENWKDALQNKRINIENKAIKLQKDNLIFLEEELNTLNSKTNQTSADISYKKDLEYQIQEGKKFIQNEVKEKIALTKEKSSYKISEGSSSKRVNESEDIGGSSKRK